MEGYGTDCYARFNRLAHGTARSREIASRACRWRVACARARASCCCAENTENFIRAAAPSRGADGVSHDLGTWERGAPINLYDAQGRRLYTKLGGT